MPNANDSAAGGVKPPEDPEAESNPLRGLTQTQLGSFAGEAIARLLGGNPAVGRRIGAGALRLLNPEVQARVKSKVSALVDRIRGEKK